MNGENMPAAAQSPFSELEEVMSGWEKIWNDLPLILTRLLAAALLAAAGLLLLRLGRKIIKKICRHKPDRQFGQQRTLHSLFLSLFNYTMYFSIAMMVLSALGVDVSSLLAVAGVGGVAIGFGCQSLVKDFVSGLFLWVEGRINVGDVVTVGGQTGTVEAMALRTTTLRGTNGNLFTIPNGDIRTVINMTRDYRCALVNITIAHGQDIPHILSALQEAMDELGKRLELEQETPQVIGLTASDARGATICIQCKCQVEEGWALEREIRLAALECLAKEGYKP